MTSRCMTNNGRSSPGTLLFVFLRGDGLGFCFANFRKERLGCGWSCHLPQQYRPSCDVASVDRVLGITVLAERRTFQREPGEHTFGTGIGQDLCIHLPVRPGLGMPSNWTCSRGSIPANL